MNVKIAVVKIRNNIGFTYFSLSLNKNSRTDLPGLSNRFLIVNKKPFSKLSIC